MNDSALTSVREALALSNPVERIEHPLALPEPCDGTVITFSRTHRTRKVYTYAAMRVDDFWYVTGSSTPTMSWAELLDFIEDPGGPLGLHTIRVAVEWAGGAE